MTSLPAHRTNLTAAVAAAVAATATITTLADAIHVRASTAKNLGQFRGVSPEIIKF